jgi:hypothetical protein
MYASLITRVRHALTAEGALVAPAPELQITDLRRDQVTTEYGTFEPDLFPPRTGTDLIVLGKAVSPKATKQMTVRVKAGHYEMDLLVVGQRVWTRGASGELVPGPAEELTELAIRYEEAFGGAAMTEYGPVPETSNPVGKGFYLTEDEALGKPLPRIEDPAAPVLRWNERPAPVGLGPYPRAWGLRLVKVASIDPETKDPAIHPEKGLFDQAHPRLAGQRLAAGETITLEGMRLAGPLHITIPPCPFALAVTLGDAESRLDLKLEEVLVDLDTSLVDLTYRKSFKYETVRHEKRTTVLLPASEPRAQT